MLPNAKQCDLMPMIYRYGKQCDLKSIMYRYVQNDDMFIIDSSVTVCQICTYSIFVYFDDKPV